MKRKAFTLIELAIVLTIIGLLVGGSFKVMKMMREKAKIVEAKGQVLVAKDAVIGFAMENYFLPISSEFNQNLSPIKNSNHPLFFATDYNLSQSDICAYISTTLKIIDNGATPVKTINNVAFIVAHEGVNYNMQTALNGAKEVHIYGADAKVDDNTTPVNIVEHYDDIVEWITLKQLQENVGCVNVPFRFINDKLPNAKEDIAYNAALYVENNVSDVTITCDLTSSQDHNITFTPPNILSGIPNPFGEVVYDCTARENSHSNRAPAEKRFVIPIDPNYNRETNAACALDSECGGGYCVNNQCSSGMIGDTCVDGGDCVSAFCAGGVCTTGAFDAPCDDGGDCRSGICRGGVCSGQIGSSCSVHAECLSGYCDPASLCAIMPSGGGDSNSTGDYYTVSSIFGGSYKLNAGACIASDTTGVASGTIMEIFSSVDCPQNKSVKTGTVDFLDSSGDHIVECNKFGTCS